MTKIVITPIENFLRDAISDRGMSVSSFCTLCIMSRQTFYNIMRGDVIPSRETKKRMTNALMTEPLGYTHRQLFAELSFWVTETHNPFEAAE
jgi:transcriptional regulator with XRE-family HTH domain